MADFNDIIQEINTNLPDNNTQAITAAKLRTTLIDLTNTTSDVLEYYLGTPQVPVSLNGEILDKVIYNKDGTYNTFTGSAATARSVLFNIPNPSYSYTINYRTIGPASTYENCVSVLFRDANNNVTGWLYDQDGSDAQNVYNKNIGRLPANTTNMIIWIGTPDTGVPPLCTYTITDVITITTIQQEIDNLSSLISNASASISKFYKRLEPTNVQSGVWLTANGTQTNAVYSIYEYKIDPSIRYTIDCGCASALYPDFVNYAYFDSSGTLISYKKFGTRLISQPMLFNYALNDIPTNAAKIKISLPTAQYESNDCGIREYSFETPFFGKKLCVIGDSISTNGVLTTPYVTVTSSMVGTTISTYVTYYDTHNQSGTAVTKTIGGTTLTNAMNDGQLHSFTPVAADVGKTIGTPKYYSNNDSILTWDTLLGRLLGMRVVANASYSGSSLTSSSEARGNIFTGCAAWRDYTVNRCEGPRWFESPYGKETPDIIIVYRGTNDFSYTNTGNFGSQTLDDPDLSNGLDYANYSNDFTNNTYQFKEAYYVLVNKLRQKYPKALICCATLNVFKRVIYDTWPTRNNVYTLPQYNKAIRDIAGYAGCPVINLDKDGITFQNCYSEGYITDSDTTPTHPNQKGHWQMACKAAVDLTSWLTSTTFEI